METQSRFHFDHVYFAEPVPYESLLLYQIGDLGCRPGYVSRAHTQQCYEINLVVSGKGTAEINHVPFPVETGDVVLTVPGDIHYFRADDREPFRLFYVGFRFRENADPALLPLRRTFDRPDSRVTRDKYDMGRSFVDIFEEILNLNTFSSYMIEASLRRILVAAYRSYGDGWESYRRREDDGDKARQTVYATIHYIDRHLLEIKELDEIARRFNYSYSHLTRLFSKKTGMTMKEYYNRKRFEKAVSLLQEGELSVTQIAEMLGYRSIHTFSKAFRSHFGIAPSAYMDFVLRQKMNN